jgi:hypothetical protein
MKKHFTILIITLCVIAITTTFSCNKKEEAERAEKLHRIEQLLPGTWKIDVFEIAWWNFGIEFNGEIINFDTTLYNLGTLYIPQFSTDSLQLDFSDSQVPLFYKKDTTIFNFSMTNLFPELENNNDYFTYFRSALLPEQINDSPNSKFVLSSSIFSHNYIIDIVDGNHIRLIKANSPDHILSLSRIE